jgi:hypothetical protein
MLPTKRSAIALARGARTGVLMMLTSTAVNTASKAVVNLVSRSRPDEEPEALAGVVEIHEEVASQLGRRNSLQVGPAHRGAGSRPALCRSFQMVEAPIR